MRLVALSDGLGRIEADGTVAALRVQAPDLGAVLRSEIDPSVLADAPVRWRRPMDEVSLGSVVGGGATIWGIGLNYRSKQLATGRDAPAFPTLFIKAPTAVVPSGRPIVLPPASAAVDIEAEVAIIVGRHLYQATRSEAERSIRGFVVANDVTARDVMRATGNPSLAKSFPSFGQFGAVVAGVEELEGLAHMRISSSVDGSVWQEDRCGDLLLDVGELLALLSRHAVLRPGDLVLTGTPSGSGDERGQYLRPGSEVTVAAGDLPPLVTAVVESPAGSAADVAAEVLA